MSDISALICNMYCKKSCQPNSAVMKPSCKKWKFFNMVYWEKKLIKITLNYLVHRVLWTDICI